MEKSKWTFWSIQYILKLKSQHNFFEILKKQIRKEKLKNRLSGSSISIRNMIITCYIMNNYHEYQFFAIIIDGIEECLRKCNYLFFMIASKIENLRNQTILYLTSDFFSILSMSGLINVINKLRVHLCHTLQIFKMNFYHWTNKSFRLNF